MEDLGNCKTTPMEIEISEIRLDLEHTRIMGKQDFSRMLSSIERFGQLSPVTVVSDKGSGGWILTDGYLRIRAMKRLGTAQVQAVVYGGGLREAIVQRLLGSQGRKCNPVEQGTMVKELLLVHSMGKPEVAEMLGKTQSWISRRLSLVETLPEEILREVLRGSLCPWVASRILVPMARAIPEHAKSLSRYLAKNQETHSSREMAEFWKHYQKSTIPVRENMVRMPLEFFRTLRLQKEEKEAGELKKGIEGRWIQDAVIAGKMLLRLGDTAPAMMGSTGFEKTKAMEKVRQVWGRLRNHFRELESFMKGVNDGKGKSGVEGNNQESIQKRCSGSPDLQSSQGGQKHSAKSCEAGRAGNP